MTAQLAEQKKPLTNKQHPVKHQNDAVRRRSKTVAYGGDPAANQKALANVEAKANRWAAENLP